MDKLQALLAVSKPIVIGAKATDEAKLCAAFRAPSSSFLFSQIEDGNFSVDANTCILLYVGNLVDYQKNRAQLFLAKITPEQILLFCDENTEKKIKEEFPGDSLFFSGADYAISFLQLWEERLFRLLQQELFIAGKEGLLGDIEKKLALKHQDTEARARLTYALATQVSLDLHQIECMVRLALYYPLIALDDWSTLAQEQKRLWPIIPLLEQKLLLGRIPLVNSCPQDLSLELLVVESALFAQRNSGQSEKVFRAEMKKFSAELPFKLRTQIRNGVERCFKYLWVNNEAA